MMGTFFLAVHKTRGPWDLHYVPRQLEVGEEVHQDYLPGQAGFRPLPGGECIMTV